MATLTEVDRRVKPFLLDDMFRMLGLHSGATKPPQQWSEAVVSTWGARVHSAETAGARNGRSLRSLRARRREAAERRLSARKAAAEGNENGGGGGSVGGAAQSESRSAPVADNGAASAADDSAEWPPNPWAKEADGSGKAADSADGGVLVAGSRVDGVREAPIATEGQLAAAGSPPSEGNAVSDTESKRQPDCGDQGSSIGDFDRVYPVDPASESCAFLASLAAGTGANDPAQTRALAKWRRLVVAETTAALKALAKAEKARKDSAAAWQVGRG